MQCSREGETSCKHEELVVFKDGLSVVRSADCGRVLLTLSVDFYAGKDAFRNLCWKTGQSLKQGGEGVS